MSKKRGSARLLVGASANTPLARRYIALPFTEARVRYTRDLFGMVRSGRRALRPLTKLYATDFTSTFHCGLGSGKVDLFHLFNAVSTTSVPWVATFEHYLPRWNHQSRWGTRLLAGNACRRLIAMSGYAARRQAHYLDQHPDLKEQITPKLCVVHPTQPLLIDDYGEKPLVSETISFTFIGREFFRKGGREVLLAFERLLSERLPVRLTIVSSLDIGDYASHSTAEDRQWARGMLAKLQPTCEFFERRSNPEVLDILRTSHVGLLPTYDDTYGFSVLESQAAGCPVISTDVCALPEINSETLGWMIRVPQDGMGKANRTTTQDRDRLSDLIADQLYEIVRGIVAQPSTIRQKGELALQRIREECDPAKNATLLEDFYKSAVHSPHP